MLRNLNDDGFTGLEAAIVLIAFVVVAAVFSYVVLGAGFFTTQKAQETVYQGVAQSTTNILIKGNVYGFGDGGNVGTVSPNIVRVNFTLGLAPGAPTIDLNKLYITYSTGTIAPMSMNRTLATAPDLLNVKTFPNVLTTGYFWASSASMGPDQQVDISFNVPPAAAGTIMNLEIRPPGGGAAIPFTKTVPATITDVNVLH
jgi:flagellin FlaB